MLTRLAARAPPIAAPAPPPGVEALEARASMNSLIGELRKTGAQLFLVHQN